MFALSSESGNLHDGVQVRAAVARLSCRLRTRARASRSNDSEPRAANRIRKLARPGPFPRWRTAQVAEASAAATGHGQSDVCWSARHGEGSLPRCTYRSLDDIEGQGDQGPLGMAYASFRWVCVSWARFAVLSPLDRA